MIKEFHRGGIKVEQYRTLDEKFGAPILSWKATDMLSIGQAEKFQKELAAAIRYAKQASIRTGTKGR